MLLRKGVRVAAAFVCLGALWKGAESLETTEYILALPEKPLVKRFLAMVSDGVFGGFFLGIAFCALVVVVYLLQKRPSRSDEALVTHPVGIDEKGFDNAITLIAEEEETRVVKKRIVMRR
jgi:hypothetical protein